MEHVQEFNSWAFIVNGGPISITVALILLVMSVASWYLMLVKSVQLLRARSATSAYIRQFWQAATLDAAVRAQSGASPVTRLAHQSVEAAEHHQQHASKRLGDACSQDEFIARVMRRAISEENARLESGLTVLASVGSVAPFVGLFGTVWGIYHALASISISGQATLDKVAGPVGEALIMTAIGLAVAIPAVLAYNALVRGNRVLLAQIEGFAHDLHTLLTTGAPLLNATNARNAASAKSHAHLKEVTA
ncbi:MAG TPA: MotA/TolQ/ExbB proton channel family protein [Methylophilaceae bacterium]|nr:MotA/TolQ/ExbB proton channel family protein [Methylophilaceae bacterium]